MWCNTETRALRRTSRNAVTSAAYFNWSQCEHSLFKLLLKNMCAAGVSCLCIDCMMNYITLDHAVQIWRKQNVLHGQTYLETVTWWMLILALRESRYMYGHNVFGLRWFFECILRQSSGCGARCKIHDCYLPIIGLEVVVRFVLCA